ncbi:MULTISPECIES: ABC transporter permease [Roseobacteraceae]|uniref:FtsX-like permease family protein n=1 Tax=Pseudosulfitobacter pseudonitzschiae TaxID=1402135 RepID=A0A221JW09_9RHOB|nr:MULTISPECIES: FtsX-like permease family protein [Roseobacteraceae]ASM70928.1 FtsX-like permease family protein [Pseudosulfitobacter pseudonitzschiae]
MSLRIAARLARRELRGGLHGFRIFLACLALGVAAIAAIGSVRSAIEAGLAREGAALLGGQAEMDFTYRFATDAERAWMGEVADEISQIVDFRSMAVVDRDGSSERGLTQVKAVDDAYPLIGSVGLTPDIPLAQALGDQNGLPGAIMEQVLADRLGLTAGDTLRLGTQDFHLSALLTREPDRAGAGFGLGPRTIVRTQALEASGLLATGTLFNTKYRLILPPQSDLDTLEQTAESKFGDAGMRWRDSRNGAPGVARFVERLGAFLVLVGLSGLAVGGVGVSAAVRAYLAEKTSVIATLRTLGAERATIFQTYFIQIGALSLLGIFIGLVLGAVAPLLLAPMIEARLPIPAKIAVYPRPLVEAAIYGVLTAFIFTLWPLARAEDVRAATLFRDALGSTRLLPKARYVIAAGVGLALLVGLAGLFSGTWRLTLWMAGGITGALVLLALAAWVIRWTSRRGARMAQGHPALRWALAAISGPREGATSTVLSLGLGLSVLAAVGQIDGNLRTAIAGNLPDVAPSYFFVDIQKDQMDGFNARLAYDPDVRRVDSAPMLRGVITRINDKPAREVAGDHWVTRGDRGVTYATNLPERTKITAGEWWAPDYTGPPLISFATEEADEMGLRLGDTMTINVLGREITGTITSFREVDFSNAGIGFVMTMNPAALSGAPHSYISTVYAEPEAEAAILRDLGTAYPNITAIRVRDAIDRVAEVLAGVAAASSYGAAATLLTGFLVLIGAASAGTQSRTYEAAVLKTLGASRRRILISFAIRAALLGLAAGLVALGAGIAGGWAVSRFVMETGYQVIWPSALAIIAGGVLATLMAGLAFAWGPLSARPAHVLRARE